MKILLLCDSFNCLTQGVWAELTDRGHDVSVEFALNPALMVDAVKIFQPELIIAPLLTKKIPPEIWQNYTCLVVHPGIKGDRGPSSLDWAILEGRPEWGVTILAAAEEMDAGDIWWSKNFAMSARSKSSLYRREVADLAKEGLLLCVERFLSKQFTPTPLDYAQKDVNGQLKPAIKSRDRLINWQTDSTSQIMKKIHSGDSQPGALAMLGGHEFHLFNATQGDGAYQPGQIFATNSRGICIGTIDGSIMVGHVRPKGSCQKTIKLSANAVLSSEDLAQAGGRGEVFYEKVGDVALLYFEFYNGAMSTAQCHELHAAYVGLVKEGPRAIVLMGGAEFFSNGINLNTIEAAADPAEEAWQNILAMNSFVRAVLCSEDVLTISLLRANAGAGGAMMALAADLVWAHRGVVVNPHYKGMGGLYGSEFWTYSLPKKVGPEHAHHLTESLLPLSAAKAHALGLVDRIILDEKKARLANDVQLWLASNEGKNMLANKNKYINSQDWLSQINLCEANELAHMRQNFFHETAFHEARRNFVYKIAPSQTPLHLAWHRR